MYESLTVFETLWYAAQLRLPRNMTMTKKKEARVHRHQGPRPRFL